MFRLYKRPRSDYWYIEINIDGIISEFRRSSKLREKKKAYELAERWHSKFIEQGNLSGKVPITLDFAFAKYLKEQARHFKDSSFVISNAKILMDYFGKNILIHELDVSKLRAFIAYRRDGETYRKKPRKPATINRSLQVLRMCINYLEEAKLYKLSDVKIGKLLLREPEAIVRYISVEKARELIAAAPEHSQPIIEIALLTGLRRMNILNLSEQNIFWDEGEIRIKQKSKLPDGKTIIVPMSKRVKEILKSQKTLDGFFFHYKGKKLTDIQRGWEITCKKIGLEGFRFHDLRHTCASWLVQRGTPIEIVKEILGHSDIKTTLKYAHHNKEKKISELEKIKI